MAQQAYKVITITRNRAQKAGGVPQQTIQFYNRQLRRIENALKKKNTKEYYNAMRKALDKYPEVVAHSVWRKVTGDPSMIMPERNQSIIDIAYGNLGMMQDEDDN